MGAILIGLDELLDTRLVNYDLNHNEHLGSVLSEGYKYRIYDRFKGVSWEEVQESYSERNKEWLKEVLPTRMQKVLPQLVLNKTNALTPDSTDTVKVFINVWPYELDTEELRVVRDSLFTMVNFGKTELTMINVPLEEMSCQWLNQNDILSMWLYDGESWFNHHYKENMEIRSPKTALHVPFLITIPVDDITAVLDATDECSVHPATITENAVKPIINLVYEDAVNFTAMDIPDIHPRYRIPGKYKDGFTKASDKTQDQS